MNPMKIYIIRHGETTGDIEDRYGGDYDDHLSSLGIKQAQELGEKLRGRNIEMIYHSLKIRAVETAKIVSEIINSPIQEIGEIRERNAYGCLTGMIKKDAEEKYPEEVLKIKKDKLYHDVIDSEDYVSFKERVLPAFRDIMSDSQFESIAIISHGGPIGCFAREVLKLGELKRLGDCAIIELETSDNEIKLISLDNAELDF